jgi:WhiB family redox-sensing transcriptional regulator
VDDALTVWLMTPDAPDLDAVLASLIDRPSWHREAACRGAGTAMFFPVLVGDPAPTKEARALCASCPVTAECLRAALEDPLTVGVWAGTTARGRKAMRKSSSPQIVAVRPKRRLAG